MRSPLQGRLPESAAAALAGAAAALVCLVVPMSAAASTSASADFNGDGFADLAVGAPADSVGGHEQAGAVNVLYGSAGGIGADGNQQFTQDSPGIAAFASANDRFGAALAAGDLNGDGASDLVVGVPGEDASGRRNAGVVNVIYGSNGGLTAEGNRFLGQGSGLRGRPERDENFGHALTIADFDGDGFDDLAVGVRDESVAGRSAAGAVNVVYGSSAGLQPDRNQLWHQGSPGVAATPGSFDRFGFALAAGDADGDGRADLAAGVPGERIRGSVSAGAVNVLYGAAGGLRAEGDQLWSQGVVGLGGRAERGDNFGRALAMGDFDGDGRADLAAAAPMEGVGGRDLTGAVSVIFGSPGGLNAAGDELWHQNSAGIRGTPERNDRFGTTLAAGDPSSNGIDDLAVGVPAEGVGGRPGAGVVHVLYGGAGGLRSGPDDLWHQGSRGVAGAVERFDRFGRALAIGDFDRDGADDLAAGVPDEGHSGHGEAGAVNLLYGSITGVTTDRGRLWHQGHPGILGAVGDDRFGGAVASGPAG